MLTQKHLNVINAAKGLKRHWARHNLTPKTSEFKRLYTCVEALETYEANMRKEKKRDRAEVRTEARISTRGAVNSTKPTTPTGAAKPPPVPVVFDWVMIRLGDKILPTRRDTLGHLKGNKTKFTVVWSKGAATQDEAVKAYAQEVVDSLWKKPTHPSQARSSSAKKPVAKKVAKAAKVKAK